MTAHQRMIALLAGSKIMLLVGDDDKNKEQLDAVEERLTAMIPKEVEGEEDPALDEFIARACAGGFNKLTADKGLDMLDHHFKEWCIEEEVNKFIADFSKKPS